MRSHVYESARDLCHEYARVNLGDKRRNARLLQILDRWQSKPAASFPKMMGSEAELEGLYRFVNSDWFSHKQLLAPHFGESGARAREGRRCLVLHDTTDVSFNREKPPEDMGYTRLNQRGFFLHASLAVEGTGPCLPLGLVAAEFLHRPKPTKKAKVDSKKRAAEPDNESRRWMRGVRNAVGNIGPGVQLVHVMDREGDDYKLFDGLMKANQDFVIRVMHNRRVADETGSKSKIFEELALKPSIATREVMLGARKEAPFAKQRKIHPKRSRRTADLHISFAPLSLVRPDSALETNAERLEVVVVHVYEPDPPAGEPAVDWKLVTTLPVTSAEEALEVVDIYRQRWVIEEFFKALKTGTQLFSRQVESVQAIQNVVALSLPVAWQLLVFRAHARLHPDAPADRFVSPLQLTILRTFGRTNLPDEPSIEQVAYAIAAMAGHLKRNGPPGWQLLSDGLQQLTTMEMVWRAASEK